MHYEGHEKNHPKHLQHLLYNGMDCCLTHEIASKLLAKMTDDHAGRLAYEWESRLNKVAIAASLAGIRVDHAQISTVAADIRAKQAAIRAAICRISNAIIGRDINPLSPVAIKPFLYDVLDAPNQYKRDGNTLKLTTDEEALENITKSRHPATAFCTLILRYRELNKLLSVFAAPLDRDGRLRTNFKVAGTVTWRWSSSASNWNTGTNVQNITDVARRIVIPDEGHILYNADLKQADSNVVAYDSGDANYIAACNSGDLHTTVTKMIWPSLPWTGTDTDIKIAKSPFFKEITYRDLAKVGGHGSTYGGSAPALARQMKIEERLAYRFQMSFFGGRLERAKVERWARDDKSFEPMLSEGVREGGFLCYEGAFPGIRKWQQEKIDALREDGYLISPFGLRRTFRGRRSDTETWKRAFIFIPQHTVGMLINAAILKLPTVMPYARFMLQVHDSILFQAPAEIPLATVLADTERLFHHPLSMRGGTMNIPPSIEWGYNWGKRIINKDGTMENPNGLR